VFSFYDMTFNVTFVAGAALAAAFIPATGHAPVVIALIAAGYLVAAVAYWLAGRESSGPGAPDMPSPAAQSSSS
jgi:ABC-type uncharacterized transport system permease subunit